MTPQDILSGAADIIEQNGWHQGGYATAPAADGGTRDTCPTDPNATCFCVFGAMRRVLNLGDNVPIYSSHAYRTARNLLSNVIGDRRPAEWNDAPGRTKGEVVAALRADAS
jgi:hypothetical protein